MTPAQRAAVLRRRTSLDAQVQAALTGKNAVMLDMTDLSTLYQDAAGTTAVTTATQPIGLVFDKAAVVGSELLANGDFSGGTTSWTISATGTGVVTSGVLRVTSVSGRGAVSQAFATTIGQRYRLKFGLISNGNAGANAAICRITSDNSYSGTQIVQVGTAYSGGYQFFTATTTTTYVWLADNTATSGNYVDFGAVSIKSDGGNHATQSIAGARPLLQTNNGKYAAQFDGTDDALILPNIAWTGGALNSFVASNIGASTKGVHIWRTADSGGGFWAVYDSTNAITATGANAGSPSYAVNAVAVSPQTRTQMATVLAAQNSVLETIGLTLSANTSLQIGGYAVPFALSGPVHRVLLVEGTLTAPQIALFRTWTGQGIGLSL